LSKVDAGRGRDWQGTTVNRDRRLCPKKAGLLLSLAVGTKEKEYWSRTAAREKRRDVWPGTAMAAFVLGRLAAESGREVVEKDVGQ